MPETGKNRIYKKSFSFYQKHVNFRNSLFILFFFNYLYLIVRPSPFFLLSLFSAALLIFRCCKFTKLERAVSEPRFLLYLGQLTSPLQTYYCKTKHRVSNCLVICLLALTVASINEIKLNWTEFLNFYIYYSRYTFYI